MGARPWAEGYFEALAFVLSEFLHHAPGSKNKPKDAQAEPDRTYPSLDSATPTAATSCCVRAIAYRRQSPRETPCLQDSYRSAKSSSSFRPEKRCVCPYRPPCHPSYRWR